jgi:hypothetical protein
MVEILNFKKGETIIKLNTAVTNLNARGILMSHSGRDKNTEHISFRWLTTYGTHFLQRTPICEEDCIQLIHIS